MRKRSYTPRRANLARWLAGAPAHILDCFDDPSTTDRYTVLYTGVLLAGRGTSYSETAVPYRAMSERPSHPQGVGMWGELTAAQAAAYRYANGKFRVPWSALPKAVQQCTINDGKP